MGTHPRQTEDVAESSATDAEAPTPATATSTWLIVGLVILALFVAILVWSVLAAPTT